MLIYALVLILLLLIAILPATIEELFSAEELDAMGIRLENSQN